MNNETDNWLLIAREQRDNGAAMFDRISGDLGFLYQAAKIP